MLVRRFISLYCYIYIYIFTGITHKSVPALKKLPKKKKKKGGKDQICPSEELILSGPREYLILGVCVWGGGGGGVLKTGEQRHPCKTIF